jgi:sterol 3beta-glucosyltransferase
MRIMILTVGSRGDIQPFVALGLGLRDADHQVTLCAPALFESFVRAYGLDFAPLNDELIRLKDTSAGKAALEGKGNVLKLMQMARPMLRRMLDDAWTAARNADPQAIVYHPKALAGLHIAEKLNIPAFLSMPLPAYTPTRAFPNPILPAGLRFGPWFNRASYFFTRLAGASFMGMVNGWRKDVLGLPPRGTFADELRRSDGRPVHALYSYSSHVIPTPDDWPPTSVATGYWFLQGDPQWKPSPELARFLDAGAPPVYVGFGSMAGTDPEGKARTILDALRLSGQRGLIASGWGGLKPADSPDHVFMIQEAPHDWLFPCVSAVVHHGGAGTTAAGLRAGKPTVICPFFGDQPFWGQRVHALGIGPKQIPQKQLTAENLAEAIREALTPAMRNRAETLSIHLLEEDGVARAMEIIVASM